MPRIPPQLVRRAFHHHPDAAQLLPACRDLPSALNELRWIREHVAATTAFGGKHDLRYQFLVSKKCRRRGRGEPLQYVLGTVPFGELEILCRRGVLIPRYVSNSRSTHFTYSLKMVCKTQD